MHRKLLLSVLAACAAEIALASAVINGSTLTFDVAEGVVETYDTAIPTNGTIKTVYKKGLGTMQLTKAGGKSRAITIYIQEGILELMVREALSSYNNFYISSNAQYYLHSSYESATGYATFCHYIKGAAGSGPDGKGAIRFDTLYDARSCFRNEVTLTGDATFYCDSNKEWGFSTGTTINLNGHTLTLAGLGKTTFSYWTYNDNGCTVNPGKGGNIVIDTPQVPEILTYYYNRIDPKAKRLPPRFLGDASSKLILKNSTQIYIDEDSTNDIPWTIVSECTNDCKIAKNSIATGSLVLCGGLTTYSSGISIGSSNTIKHASLVVKSNAVLRVSNTSNPAEISSKATWTYPALYKIEAGAIVTNKAISTYSGNSTRYKIATQCWGDFNQVGSAYLANWCGEGFFGLEDGRVNIIGGANILGYCGSRGLFLQDGGTLTYNGNTGISLGARSDYVMRGGTIKSTAAKATLYLAAADSAGYGKTDKDTDAVSFSMIGPGNPEVDLAGGFSMNSRTGGCVSVINLNAGRLSANRFSVSYGTTKNNGRFNFNGGTVVFKESKTDAYFSTHDYTPRMTTVYPGGVTFEINRAGRNYLISNDLNADSRFAMRGAFGRGIKSVKLPDDMPRTGYLGIVPVQITNADGDTTGEGAFAALEFDVAAGTVKDDLLILCPGCGYTAAPKVVAYGPDMRSTYECTVELTDEDQVQGSFVKTGVGELVLNSTNNAYTGPYVISNGILMVNRWADIPRASSVRVAGGCFRWDWCNRAIAEFGGWGTFFGSRNDNAEYLHVTTRFTVDAEDLNQGRYLSPDQNTDDGTKYAKNDYIYFGENCRVVIDNADKLDKNTDSFILLKQQTKINRLPILDTVIPETRLSLRNGRTELVLKRIKGLCIYFK